MLFFCSYEQAGLNVEIQVLSVRESAVVSVFFMDGHKAVFVPNQGGHGSAEAIEAFWLEDKHGNVMATYHSPYQRPVNRQPFGFTQMARGWNTVRVAAYWQAAQTYVGQSFMRGQLVGAWWSTVRLGIKDLQDIQGGKWGDIRGPRR